MTQKIKIITLHRVTNFGSLLQTYATEATLKKLGYDVEILDFVPEGLSFRRAVWPRGGNAVKKLLKLAPLTACNAFQYAMSDRFLRENVTLSKVQYHSYQELSAQQPDTDIYLSGSDQVWNTQNNNPEADLGAYYLAFAEGKPRIAYAGSFGRTSLSEAEQTQVKVWLARYRALSVREDTALSILHEMGLDGVHVVDPTFLLTREDWLSFYLTKRAALPQKGYVFVYNLNRNKLIEQTAKRIAQKYGLRIVNFADTFEFIAGAQNKLFNTPLDFLGYLANADYVVTDSFHGTSFSINMGKQFVTVAAPKYNSRIESVLRMMHCEDRLASTVEDALRLCERKIDYAAVLQTVEMQRKRSIDFLENALHEC